ncbi:hypothetical protein MIND_01197600 [Mycena indigotica]|uniref:Uncharacterized protein n=1 Tax=Mycena indigotica TaxID=2126181 RepID=A0A8H6VWR5_9AGAR|nr:uncharacterized protein MIND_01197600 [Mycena indigotica]KAF7292983.1 hypothetical protein MIND_01197600 [Mycena indigotica]
MSEQWNIRTGIRVNIRVLHCADQSRHAVVWMRLLYFALVSVQLLGTTAQTWCNKNYLPGQPIVPPGGRFQYDQGTSRDPLLVFRCSPIMTPYIVGEDYEAGILVEAFTTHSLRYHNARALSFPFSTLQVSISANNTILARTSIEVNSSAEVYFPLLNLSHAPPTATIDCLGSSSPSGDALGASPQTFHATTMISYLPRPLGGSVTKRDGRTGALLLQGQTGYEPVFPFGFYTSFDGYLDADLSLLDDIKAQGFTIVHPVPTFGDLEALERVLNRMEELGLLLVYDMRHTYNNPTKLAAEVAQIKNRTNLLLWYTADEPDGTSEPPESTRRAYDQIYSLDGGYHPVSVTLNCADYEFAAYSGGADVIMPDTYPVANNATWSMKYNTSCSADFGCCGCDNCVGQLEDISQRLDDYAFRLDVLGWTRAKAVWAVPQAFEDKSAFCVFFFLVSHDLHRFWARPPTGREFAAEVILSVNHGARGIMPWIDPTTEDIKSAASALARVFNSAEVKEILFNPQVRFEQSIRDRVDVGKWSVAGATLLMAANPNPHNTTVSVSWSDGVESLVYDGVRHRLSDQQLELQLESLGYGVYLSRANSFVVQNPSL